MARKVNTIYSEDEAKKPSKILPAIIIVLAVTAVILLSVFLVKYLGTQHLVTKMGGGKLEDKRHGVTYTLLSPNPYWVNLDISKPYAESDGVSYYKIVYTDKNGKEKHFDPLKMIATYDENNIVDIYVADSYTPPTLAEMSPDRSFVYYVQKTEIPATVLNNEQTQTVLKALNEKENTFYPADVDESTRLNIYLASEKYLHLRYTVEYFETEDGEQYLQDPTNGKLVKATDMLKGVFGIAGS